MLALEVTPFATVDTCHILCAYTYIPNEKFSRANFSKHAHCSTVSRRAAVQEEALSICNGGKYVPAY